MTLFTTSRNQADLQAEVDAGVDDLRAASDPGAAYTSVCVALPGHATGADPRVASVIFLPHDDLELSGFAYSAQEGTATAKRFTVQLEHADDDALGDDHPDQLSQTVPVTGAITSASSASLVRGSSIPSRRYFLRRGVRYRLTVNDPSPSPLTHLSVAAFFTIRPRRV